MTIDKCMDELEKLKLPISNHDLSFHFVELARNETIDLAIDTMRKYQKIEQILKEIPYGGDATVRRIQEVVEDGNDD